MGPVQGQVQGQAEATEEITNICRAICRSVFLLLRCPTAFRPEKWSCKWDRGWRRGFTVCHVATYLWLEWNTLTATISAYPSVPPCSVVTDLFSPYENAEKAERVVVVCLDLKYFQISEIWLAVCKERCHSLQQLKERCFLSAAAYSPWPSGRRPRPDGRCRPFGPCRRAYRRLPSRRWFRWVPVKIVRHLSSARFRELAPVGYLPVLPCRLRRLFFLAFRACRVVRVDLADLGSTQRG